MSPVTCGIQALSSVSSSRSDPQSDGRQESAAGVSSEFKAGGRAEAFFSQAASYLSVWRGGHAGESGARRGLRHDGGRIRRVEGAKIGGKELLEKRRGTNAPLYLAEGRAGR